MKKKRKRGIATRKNGGLLLLGLAIIWIGWWAVVRESRAQPEVGIIDVWATWGEAPARLQAFFDRYEAASGVAVRVETRVRSDDLDRALAAAEPPDLVLMSNADLVAAYHNQGLLEPLAEWLGPAGIDVADIYEAALAPCRAADGGLLCLPWGADVDALYWNKELFAAAGLDPDRPPRTMEEVAGYAARLTRRDEKGELSQVGFIPDFPRDHAALYVALSGGAQPLAGVETWQAQFSAGYADGELAAFVKSFTPYLTSSHPVFGDRRLSCQQCHKTTAIDDKRRPDLGFFEGHLAMMLDGPWRVSPAALAGQPIAVEYGVAPFPPPAADPERAGAAVVGGPVLAIPAGAADREAAVGLLAWLLSPEVLADAAFAHANLPTSRAATQDPRFEQSPAFTTFMELLARPEAQ